jgi:hypothetical protein
MTNSSFHFDNLDSGENLYFARQLEEMQQKVYSRKYAALKGLAHVPKSSVSGKGIQSIGHRMLDRVGAAQLGMNFPRVDILLKEFFTPVHPITDSYGYSILDVRQSARANLDLGSQKAFAAGMAIQERRNRLIYSGDEQTGLLGLFSHPNIPIQIAANSISALSTSDQIIAVVNSAITSVFSLTKGVEFVDTVLMPPTQWRYLSSTIRGSVNDTTILEILQKTNKGVTFDWANECAGAGTGGTDIMMAYCRDPEHLMAHIPSPFEQLPIAWDGKEYVVNCLEEFGGIEMIYACGVIVEGI